MNTKLSELRDQNDILKSEVDRNRKLEETLERCKSKLVEANQLREKVKVIFLGRGGLCGIDLMMTAIRP